MSQHIQGTNSSSADLPMKRKRGRPRKDESLLQGENMNFMPGSDTARKNKLSASTIEKVEDDMVGQVVSGVIEGSFDAGYLLNVKVGDTDTQLRGVVFLPGKFVPITPANDVAPHVPMWQRKEIPIPAPGSSSQSRPSKNPSVELSAPVFPNQVPPFELQSPAETASGKQPASVLLPPADNLPSFVGITAQTQQPTSESGLEISLPEQNNKQTAEFDGSALMLKDHVPSYKLEYANPTASDRQPASAMRKNDICPPFEHKIIMQQTLDSGLEIPASEHAMKKFLVLKDHGPVFPGQVPCLGVQPAVPMTLDSQSASVSLPLIDSFAKNGGGSSLEGEVGLQQTSESGPEIPPSVSKQSMGLKNQGIFSDQGPPFEIQSALSMELDNQPASATVPLADDSSKNDVPSSSEGNPLPQQTSEPEFGISSTIQENKQALELNSNTPVHAEQISPFALQLGTYATLDKHPTSESHVVPQAKSLPGSVTFPSWEGQIMSQPTLEFGLEIHPLEQGNKQQPIDQGAPFELQSATLMKNDRGPYLEARVMQQQSLFSGFGNQPAAQMTQSRFDKIAEQDEVMQEFESSNFLKNPTIHMEVTKDVVELQPASEPSFDKLPLTGTGGPVPEIEFQQQGAGSEFKLNASVHAEEKKPSSEHAAEGQGAGNDLGLRIGCEAEDRQNL